ncbi:hypothetical protein [Streptodolium elevatio]
MGVSGIYLPGWEFNRMLAADPVEPRNSALAAALLWNGAAPLWMFEKVYCTAESLACERHAAQEMGWATGRIFGELSVGLPGGGGPVLHPVDWTSLEAGPRGQVEAVHAQFRRDHPGGGQVRAWIHAADDGALEQVNHRLLHPVATSLNSVVAGSMSGLQTWLRTAANAPAPAQAQRDVAGFVERVAAPVGGRMDRNGTALLPHPRNWDPTAVAQQEAAKARAEAPLIRDLQAGEGAFAGPRGFEPYLAALTAERAAYEAVDAPLLDQWPASATRLARLRDAASQHLWPALHGDWLPALLRHEPGAAEDFPRWIAAALRQRRLGRFLKLSSACILAVVAGAGAAIGTATGNETYGVLSGAAAAAGTAGIQMTARGRAPAPRTALALFYQHAFRAVEL